MELLETETTPDTQMHNVSQAEPLPLSSVSLNSIMTFDKIPIHKFKPLWILCLIFLLLLLVNVSFW